MPGFTAGGLSPAAAAASAAAARFPLQTIPASPSQQHGPIPKRAATSVNSSKVYSGACQRSGENIDGVSKQQRHLHQQQQVSAEDMALASPVSLVSFYASCSDSGGSKSSGLPSSGASICLSAGCGSSSRGATTTSRTTAARRRLPLASMSESLELTSSGIDQVTLLGVSPAQAPVRRLSFAPAALEAQMPGHGGSCSPASAMPGDSAIAAAKASPPSSSMLRPPSHIQGRPGLCDLHDAPPTPIGCTAVGAEKNSATAPTTARTSMVWASPLLLSPPGSDQQQSAREPALISAVKSATCTSSGGAEPDTAGYVGGSTGSPAERSSSGTSNSGATHNPGGAVDDSPLPVWTATRTPRQRRVLLSDSDSECDHPAAARPAGSGTAHAGALAETVDLITPPPEDQRRAPAACPPSRTHAMAVLGDLFGAACSVGQIAALTPTAANGHSGQVDPAVVEFKQPGGRCSPMPTPPWMSNHKVQSDPTCGHLLAAAALSAPVWWKRPDCRSSSSTRPNGQIVVLLPEAGRVQYHALCALHPLHSSQLSDNRRTLVC